MNLSPEQFAKSILSGTYPHNALDYINEMVILNKRNGNRKMEKYYSLVGDEIKRVAGLTGQHSHTMIRKQGV